MTEQKKQTESPSQKSEQLRQGIDVLEAAVAEQRALDRVVAWYEQDRQLIGYEIHDGFLQQAAGALLQLQALELQLQSAPEHIRKILQTATTSLRMCIKEARRLIDVARPPLVDETGLKPAIEGLIAESHFVGGPKIQLLWELNHVELPSRLAHAIFRITQECLTNVRRHSKSNRAQVRLANLDRRLLVEVRDWGVGFDHKPATTSGVGLEGIRLRARLLGGAATIFSGPDQGTTVRVELPLQQADAPHDQAGRGTK